MRTMWTALVVVNYGRVCFKTNCAEVLHSNNCFEVNNDKEQYDIVQCSEGQKCEIETANSPQLYNFNQSHSCTPTNIAWKTKNPGEVCTDSSECLGESCLTGQCVGSTQGASCMDHPNCDVGLVCIHHSCSKQVPAGSTCSLDAECANNLLCFNGHCVPLFSLPAGTPITPSQFSSALLCESGSAENNVCTAAQWNIRPADTVCTSDEDCPTKSSDGRTGFSHCSCGLNSNGFAYCEAVQGDVEFSLLKRTLQDILPSSASCHYTTRFTSLCPIYISDPRFTAFLHAYYSYTYRHIAIGSPQCVKALLPFVDGISESAAGFESAGGSGLSKKNGVIIVCVVVAVALLVLISLCVVWFRHRIRSHPYTSRVGALTELHDDMSSLAVVTSASIVTRPGRCVAPGFRLEEIALDDSDKRFLHTGVPVAVAVATGSWLPEPEDAADTQVQLCTDSRVSRYADSVSLLRSDGSLQQALV